MNIEKELSRLRRMTPAELRQEYAQVFGEETRSGNRQHLVRRVIWKMQCREKGGLSERAKRRAEDLANDSDLRLTSPRKTKVIPFRPRQNPRLPMPGTVLTRQYKGGEIRVTVLAQGFQYEGESFRTLSSIARHVTGTHISGPRFFNLNRRGKRRNGQ